MNNFAICQLLAQRLLIKRQRGWNLVNQTMEYSDPTFAWKQLYWSAIEEGFEPWEAAEHANRQLPSEMTGGENAPRDHAAQAGR